MSATPEDRIAELERKAWEASVKLAELDSEMHELIPLVPAFANLQGSYNGLLDALAAIRQTLENRDQAASDERKAVRVALISLTGVIVAALIAAAATIIVASQAHG